MLKPQQVRKQVRGGDQETYAQAWQQGLGHGAGVNPAGPLETADDRRGAAFIKHQFAIGFIFDQGDIELVQQRRHGVALGFAVTHGRGVLEGRNQIGKRRRVLFQALTQRRQLGAIGLLRHRQAVGAEQLKRLQRGQVGRRLNQNLGARIDEQLAGQVQGLLGTAHNQYLARLAGDTQLARLLGNPLAQLRLTFAHAVLTHARRHAAPVHLRQHGFGRQAAGEGHHFRALGRGKDLANQGTFQAGNTFGKSHGNHR